MKYKTNSYNNYNNYPYSYTNIQRQMTLDTQNWG